MLPAPSVSHRYPLRSLPHDGNCPAHPTSRLSSGGRVEHGAEGTNSVKSVPDTRYGEFAVWLNQALGDRRLPPTSIAKRWGWSPATVFGWLGGRTLPNPEKAVKLAETLKVPVIEVLVRSGSVPAESFELDPTQIDYRAAIRAQHPDDADVLIEMINAFLEARVGRRVKRRSPAAGEPPEEAPEAS